MYKTILVPLDGSKRSEAILPHVKSLANCYGARVILLGVVEPRPIIVAYSEVYPQFDEKEYKQQIIELEVYLSIKQRKFHHQGITTEIKVGHGSVVEAIIDLAELENVDLIAMTSHGRTGLAQVFYGSVAAGVLHRVERPLLLIRSLHQE